MKTETHTVLDPQHHLEHVRHAPAGGDAAILAAKAALADDRETAPALAELDDGQSAVHVASLRAGMLLHPTGTPLIPNAANDIQKQPS